MVTPGKIAGPKEHDGNRNVAIQIRVPVSRACYGYSYFPGHPKFMYTAMLFNFFSLSGIILFWQTHPLAARFQFKVEFFIMLGKVFRFLYIRGPILF